MTALEVTARQFREKQKSFFEMADTGRQIVIRRGKKQAYILTPVNPTDFMLTPEIWERMEKSRQQFKNGDVTICKTYEESLKHLESL